MDENLPDDINLNEIRVLLKKQSLPVHTFIEGLNFTLDDIKKLIKNTDLSVYDIEKYRKGEEELASMPLLTAQLLQKFINETPPQVYYLYEALLGELLLSVEMGMTGAYIFIKRSDKPLLFTDYYPIIEFAAAPFSKSFQKEETKKIIDEMKRWNISSD